MDPLEELQKVVVQGFASLNAKIDSTVAAGEVRLGERIDAVERKLSDKIDGTDAKMDAGFARVDRDFEFVKRAIVDHTQELKEIRATLDKKVDRDHGASPPDCAR